MILGLNIGEVMVIGLFVGTPLIALMLWLSGEMGNRPSGAGMRPCPNCGTLISTSVRVCYQCTRDV